VFRIKICGITRSEDAVAAAECGADAIGLNFYGGSRRCVSVPQAKQIVAAVGQRVAKVGVLVNAAADSILQIADQVGLDFIQLHGDEGPEVIEKLGTCRVIRAFRPLPGELAAIRQYLEICQRRSCAPEAILVDAHAVGQFGGTGKTADWSALGPPRSWDGGRPVILAGGLTPENVAEAIQRVFPDGVDTASGVESSPGIKDAELIWRFVSAASAAWNSPKQA